MVCTTANGDKVPLAVVGKSKKPVSFDNQPPPLPYTNQANAWFDKGITRWWIQQVLLPYHNRYKGRGVPCCILLDNCSAHKLGDNEMEELERKNVFIKFLPPNLTSKRQPADMGMIASLKVGYKTFMLNELLDLFDQEGGFELAAERRQKQKKGCKGLRFGGKATVMDAIQLLHGIWSRNDKYAKVDGIKRCWRKADILPPSWNQQINNEVGSASLSDRDKKISDEDCNVLCNLMKEIQLKSANSIDTVKIALSLHASFAVDPDAFSLGDDDWRDMATNWIDIEEDEDMIEAEIEEVMEGLDESNKEEEELEEEEQIDMMEVDPLPKITKLEALQCIDTLKQYCIQKNAGDSVHAARRLFENELMGMRMQNSNTQRSMTSYFAKKD
jgi:hypothetical protein